MKLVEDHLEICSCAHGCWRSILCKFGERDVARDELREAYIFLTLEPGAQGGKIALIVLGRGRMVGGVKAGRWTLKLEGWRFLSEFYIMRSIRA